MVTGEMFMSVIGHLATQHCLIVPDLRGYGQSRELLPLYSVALHVAQRQRQQFISSRRANGGEASASPLYMFLTSINEPWLELRMRVVSDTLLLENYL